MATTTIRYDRPWLYPKQREGIFCRERYGLIEASTKSGKTVGCMAWLLEHALSGWAGRNYWWVAPVYPQAKIAFRRMKLGLPRSLYQANEGELWIRLINGAVIWFKSAEKPDNLYGEDVYAVVLDEATRMREESFHAVRSTLTATRGPLRIIGNVKGRKNWAFKMARRAEAGEPDMHFARITCYDAVQAGVITQAEVEDARRQLPESVFKELYETVPSDEGANPFGMAAIMRCTVGWYSTQPVHVWGIDLAKSVDWTVAIGLDRQGRVSAWERFQKPWNDTIETLRRVIGPRPALIDSTGVGDPILEALQRQTGTNAEGFVFTAQGKQQLMEGLAHAIQSELIRFPSGPIKDELESFEYTYTARGVRYSAPEGMHDDCVCALALAVRHLHTPRAQPARLWGGPAGEEEEVA